MKFRSMRPMEILTNRLQKFIEFIFQKFQYVEKKNKNMRYIVTFLRFSSAVQTNGFNTSNPFLAFSFIHHSFV